MRGGEGRQRKGGRIYIYCMCVCVYVGSVCGLYGVCTVYMYVCTKFINMYEKCTQYLKECNSFSQVCWCIWCDSFLIPISPPLSIPLYVSFSPPSLSLCLFSPSLCAILGNEKSSCYLTPMKEDIMMTKSYMHMFQFLCGIGGGGVAQLCYIWCTYICIFITVQQHSLLKSAICFTTQIF